MTHLPRLTCPLPRGCGKVTLQEQLRPFAESPIPSSQKSYLYPAGDAGGSRGGSDCCDMTTKADMWLRKVTLQEQAEPVAVSRVHSSRKVDIDSGRGAGGNSGQNGGSDRCDTPTKADMRLWKVTLQEQAGPVAVSRIRSSQKGDINSGRGAGGDSGQKGGSGRRSSPNRSDTAVTRRSVARTAPTCRGAAFAPKQ